MAPPRKKPTKNKYPNWHAAPTAAEKLYLETVTHLQTHTIPKLQLELQAVRRENYNLRNDVNVTNELYRQECAKSARRAGNCNLILSILRNHAPDAYDIMVRDLLEMKCPPVGGA